ncbi:MAG: hypothetical protein ACOH2A_11435 [Sphingobacteriaceae bacterium]
MNPPMKNLLSLFLLFSFNAVFAQIISPEAYKKVDIHAFLAKKAPLNKQGYRIDTVQFAAQYFTYGKLGANSRDMIIQFRARFPQVKLSEAGSSIQLYVDRKLLYIPICDHDQLWKKVLSLKDNVNVDLIIYALLITSDFERYGLANELMVQDITILAAQKFSF